MKLTTVATDEAAAGNVASAAAAEDAVQRRPQGRPPKQRLILMRSNDADSTTESEYLTENEVNTSAEWILKANGCATPTAKQRPKVPSRKRDLINLQSALSPKYIGYANANLSTPAVSDTDDTMRTTRRSIRSGPLNSSCEVQAKDNESAAVELTPKSLAGAQLLTSNSNSINYMSPIDKLLIKNGANSPSSTGFEADAEDAVTQPKRKQVKRKQKRGFKPKTMRERSAENAKKETVELQVEANVVEETIENTQARENVATEALPIPSEITDTFPTEKQTETVDGQASIEEEVKQAVDMDSSEAAVPEIKITEAKTSESIEEHMELDDSQVEAVFAEPTKTSTEAALSISNDAVKSPPPINLLAPPETENSIKSPSSISIDSAKGSSIVTDPGWPTYQVGDLYWGKLFSYCYWPCMVCPDPADQTVENLPIHPNRKSSDNAPAKFQVHVRFFADNGRRNWIKQENLLPFAGLKAYEELREEALLKHGTKSAAYRQMVPKKPKLATWHDAIEEAKTIAQLPYTERLEKFFQIYESATLNKQKRKRTNSMLQDTACSTSDMGSSLYDSTDNLSTQLAGAVKRQRSETPFSPAFSPVKHNHEFRAKRRKLSEADTQLSIGDADATLFDNSEFSQLFDAVKEYVMMQQQDARVEKCLLAVVRNIWSMKQLKLRELERQLAANEHEMPLGSAVVERSRGDGSIKRLSNRLKTIMLRRSMTPVVTLTPSDTPTPTPLVERRPSEQPVKITRNRPIDQVVEDILQLDRKYLFRGLSREPVCKYCHEPGGNIQRCSRSCNSWLHVACIEEQLKAKPAKKLTGKAKALLAGQNLEQPQIKSEHEPLAHEKAFSSSSPISNKEEPVAVPVEATEAAAEIVCHECATKAPETCCICHSVEASSSASPPASPIKGSGDEQPSTSGAAAAALLEPQNLIVCNQPLCTRKFHASCCKYWPQAKITKSSARCPMHVCHTCVSDDPRGKFQQLGNTKLAKCVKCPATYHIDSGCIPAGSQMLTMTHMICPRHNISKVDANVNVLWCYICVKGGELVCCETCPIAVHAHCRNIPIKEHEGYICEECESGRLPLYGEIVWAKFTYFRWWPAIILPPPEIPSNILKKAHGPNDFVVRFFGTHDHGWISRRRVYLYIEGDTGDNIKSKSQLYKSYEAGVQEASHFLKIIKAKRLEQIKDNVSGAKLHPQPYVKIKANKPFPPVRFVYNAEDVSVCECNPDAEHPCGPESGCLNRMLYHECNPDYCPAGSRCENQMFEKRKSPRLDVIYLNERGFGLVCREPIAEGDFIVEYVGEVINHAEFRQRMAHKTRERDENYYFLGVEKDFIIDAGPKGNLARFMNHSCDPNCETQKWNVNSIHRVGLFAIKDIPADTELTFNYLWDDLMNNGKKACFCGAARCSGEIGGKLKEEVVKEPSKVISKLKRMQQLKTSRLRIQIGPAKAAAKKRKPTKHISADDTPLVKAEQQL